MKSLSWPSIHDSRFVKSVALELTMAVQLTAKVRNKFLISNWLNVVRKPAYVLFSRSVSGSSYDPKHFSHMDNIITLVI